VGDITGDGRDDILGSTLLQNFGTDKGAPWLIPSPLPPGLSPLKTAGVQLVDATPGFEYDYWLAPHFNAVQVLDDLNGDGLPELALGSYTQYFDGVVYIVASPISAMPGTQSALDPSYGRIATDVAGSFGYSIAAGPLDGLGLHDDIA
jgi:hypothetical protein